MSRTATLYEPTPETEALLNELREQSEKVNNAVATIRTTANSRAAIIEALRGHGLTGRHIADGSGMTVAAVTQLEYRMRKAPTRTKMPATG